MKDLRKKAIYLAFATFVIGDVVTTYFAMFTPGLYEANGLAAHWFENYNMGALFLFKFVIFMILHSVDSILSEYWDYVYIPIIPAIMIWEGIAITLHNIVVLTNAGINPMYVVVVIVAISVVLVRIIKTESA